MHAEHMIVVPLLATVEHGEKTAAIEPLRNFTAGRFYQRRNDIHVLRHETIPPNDGGLAIGQAAIAAAHLSVGHTESEVAPCA